MKINKFHKSLSINYQNDTKPLYQFHSETNREMHIAFKTNSNP